jgi:tubulin-folding cofactor B
VAHHTPPITTYFQITDTNPSVTFTGQLSDVSQVEKFELSEEAYAQRNGNVALTHQRFRAIFSLSL